MAQPVVINHMIIGAADARESADFYCALLKYSPAGTFIDTGTGGEGIVLVRQDSPQLLIVPFVGARLPNPQHVAFEVSRTLFNSTYEACLARGLKVRSAPPLDWEGEGIGVLQSGDQEFEHFYVCDPSAVNVEIMTLKS